MQKIKLLTSLLIITTLTGCNKASNDSIYNSTSTSIEEATSNIETQLPDSFDGSFNPFFAFDFNSDSFMRRVNDAKIIKEVFEDVEMKTTQSLSLNPEYQEGKKIEDRDYDDAYIHWIEHCNNLIYSEIVYPENFNENEKYTTVIMAHGYQSATATYIPYISDLQNENYIFISFDFRGAGEFTKSDGSLMEMTLDTLVGDLKAVIAYAQNLPYVDTNNMYLFGHSLGGLVASIAMTSIYFDGVFNGVTLLAPAFTIARYYFENYTFDNIPSTTDLLGFTISGEFVASCLRHSDLFDNSHYYQNEVLMFLDDDDPYIDNNDSLIFAETLKEKCSVFELNGPDHFFIDEESRRKIDNEFVNLVNRTHKDN